MFKNVLKGILGMTVAGSIAAAVLIQPWESRQYVAYLDPVDVWTYCDGITDVDNLKYPPYVYSDEECDEYLAEEINKHEAGLDKCLHVELPDETKAAFISWAFNVGVNAACKSTLVRKANNGDIIGACNELSRWVYAGGRRFRGLENRRFKGDNWRLSERALCLEGLEVGEPPSLYDQWVIKFDNWRNSHDTVPHPI